MEIVSCLSRMGSKFLGTGKRPDYCFSWRQNASHPFVGRRDLKYGMGVNLDVSYGMQCNSGLGFELNLKEKYR